MNGSTLSAALHSGWLEKRGPTAKYGWKRRWCVLQDGCFEYFDNDNKNERLGQVCFMTASKVIGFRETNAPGDCSTHCRERPCGFMVDENSKAGKSRHLYYFDAGQPDNLQIWLEAFKSAMDKVPLNVSIKPPAKTKASRPLDTKIASLILRNAYVRSSERTETRAVDRGITSMILGGAYRASIMKDESRSANRSAASLIARGAYRASIQAQESRSMNKDAAALVARSAYRASLRECTLSSAG